MCCHTILWYAYLIGIAMGKFSGTNAVGIVSSWANIAIYMLAYIDMMVKGTTV